MGIILTQAPEKWDSAGRPIEAKFISTLFPNQQGGQSNLPIFDLGDVFEGEKGPIYADHIHFDRDAVNESRGNRLVAARMGQLLAETWGLQRKP